MTWRKESVWLEKRTLSVRMSVLWLGLAAAACGLGDETPGEHAETARAARQRLTTEQERVLGFESLADWSASAGTLAGSTNTTQGSQALAVTPAGWTEIDSIPLNSLGAVKSTLSYDLFVPEAAQWGETRAVLIAPSLGLHWAELGSRSLAGLPAGQYHTVSFAIPSEVRAALAGEYTDLTIKLVINAPAFSSPYLFDRIDLASTGGPSGSATLTTLSISTPAGVPPEGTFLSATGHLSVFSQAVVGATGQTPAIVNFGAGQSYLQAEAKAHANLYSTADVQLDAKTFVGGFVRTAGIVGKQGVGTGDEPVIAGGEFAPVAVDAAVQSFTPSLPSTNLGDVRLSAVPEGETFELSLEPGAYGHFDIHDRNVVTLHSGVYSFESFNTEPQAEIRLDKSDGPIFIYVREFFLYKGAFVDDGVALGQTLVGYLGTSDAFVQAPFTGTLVAPNATIRLERPTSGQHRGSFFGEGVEVAAGQHTVLHVPFQHWNTVLRDTSHQGDNAPEPPLRARWVRPDGMPIRSFSYAPVETASLLQLRSFTSASQPPLPNGRLVQGSGTDGSPFSGFVREEQAESELGGPQIMALQPPSDSPVQQLTIQIENTTTDSLGTTVAYSVMVRTWGLGNFFGDSTIVPASTATFIGPGELRSETFDVTPHLVIQSPEMAAKADFAVGLHRILPGNVIEETPFAFVGVPSFYYNFTPDRTAAYVYGLERPPAGSAPPGEVEIDGLVERYRNGVLGGNMFEPIGFVGSTPADEARQHHLEVFADRRHAIFGVRPSTHDVDASGNLVNLEPPLPPEGNGGFNDPFDPATGPTQLCWRWPVSYVDKGAEPYPAVIADAEWHGLVDFIPAAFGFAELFRADGTPIASGRLDANGCLPPQNLGIGNYLFRIFTHSFENSGVRFRVEAAEPVEQPDTSPFFIAPRRAFSLTASVFIHQPGGTFHLQTGFWTHTTNLAGVACHTLRRHFGGVDMGLVAGPTYLMAADDIDCFDVDSSNPGLCNDMSIFPVSHYAPDKNTLFIAPASDVWTHDARWKFVIGHELGHEVQDFANAGLRARYRFVTDTDRSSPSNSSGQIDPESALATPELTRDCSCSFVEPENASHCLHSVEVSEPAQGEGFGHFFAARLWNRVPGEEGYAAGTCNFQYYKQVSSINLVSSPMIHPVPVNCSAVYAHRDMLCDPVQVLDSASNPLVPGIELDWLAFFWDVTTNPAAPSQITVTQLLTWYASAVDTLEGMASSPNARRLLNVEDLIAAAPASLQTFLTERAEAHAVHDNR